MDKRKRADRKSSSSDTEINTPKRHLAEAASLSESIAAANSVLYEDVQRSATMSSDANPAKTDVNAYANDVNDKFEQVLSAVKEIKISQDNLSKKLDSKLDKLKNELTASIDGKISKLRDDIIIDMNRESARIDQLFKTIQSMQGRIDTLEGAPTHQAYGPSPTDDNDRYHGYSSAGLADPDVCVIVTGLVDQQGEDILQRAKELVAALGEEVTSAVQVTGATRLRAKLQGRSGPVKISFRSLNEKVRVLRKKTVLKDSDMYKDVYIKSSKSHAERLIELNARTLLNQIPQGKNFRVDASGRIRVRQGDGQRQPPPPQSGH